MTEKEAQRELLKRLLKAMRRRETLYVKEHLRIVNEKKYGQAARSFSDGMAEAGKELVGYMENVLADLEEGIAVEKAKAMEEEDNG